jgi:hypothetical protein
VEPGAPDATVDAHAYPAKPTGQNERDITGRRSTGRCRERSRLGEGRLCHERSLCGPAEVQFLREEQEQA